MRKEMLWRNVAYFHPCLQARFKSCRFKFLRRPLARFYWEAPLPTVPEGSGRLRVTLSALHTTEQMDALLEALTTVLPHRKPD